MGQTLDTPVAPTQPEATPFRFAGRPRGLKKTVHLPSSAIKVLDFFAQLGVLASYKRR